MNKISNATVVNFENSNEPVDRNYQMFSALWLRAAEPVINGLCEIAISDKLGKERIETAHYLEGFKYSKGDEVLCFLAENLEHPIVLGRLAEGKWKSDREDSYRSLPSASAHPNESTFIGICVDDLHPTLKARCLVKWEDSENNKYEKWLPHINGISPSCHDYVIFSRPANWTEYVITGIFDGLVPLEKDKRLDSGHFLQLKSDQSIQIQSFEGKPLIEIKQDGNNPVIKLLNDQLEIEIDGNLRFSGRSISFEAKKGNIQLKSSDDVVVKGETIQLN